MNLEYRQCGAWSLCLLVLFYSFRVVVSVFLLLSFTMSFSSGDDGSALDCVARGPGLAVEFHAGCEGWL